MMNMTLKKEKKMLQRTELKKLLHIAQSTFDLVFILGVTKIGIILNGSAKIDNIFFKVINQIIYLIILKMIILYFKFYNFFLNI